MTTKKVLFTSHVANFAKFNLPYMNWFHDRGWEVHYASMGEESVSCCDKHFIVPFTRSPYRIDNINAYFQLKKIIDNENYQCIHCHTPVGGAITRLAAHNAHNSKTKVLYTAHGFHFYKGSPFKNWLLYYPIEKFLSKWTDCLLVLNKEDFLLAQNKKFSSKRLELINGVGIDLNRFSPCSLEERLTLRNQLGLSWNNYTLLYVAEFIPRKNHQFLLENFAALIKEIPSARLLLAGSGELVEYCKNYSSKLRISDYVSFLGYCKNVNQLCNAADVLISTSIQEGLPVNILEGMASGLPTVCTAVRGQTDLIQHGSNGFLFSLGDSEEFLSLLKQLYYDPRLRQKVGAQARLSIQPYSLKCVMEQMALIYQEVLFDDMHLS